MSKYFPHLRDVDVLEQPNPSYAHSLWLAFYIPIATMPEILWKAIGLRLLALGNLYLKVIWATVVGLLGGLNLFFWCTCGTFYEGLRGRLGLKQAK